jgi:hypothetical protein
MVVVRCCGESYCLHSGVSLYRVVIIDTAGNSLAGADQLGCRLARLRVRVFRQHRLALAIRRSFNFIAAMVCLSSSHPL